MTQIALLGAFAGYAGGGGLSNSTYSNYCRDKGYLPADYLEREANHRESILELPTLTPADIAYGYRHASVCEMLRLAGDEGEA